jgi:DNA invertase Pin-like site-specific DNA recombinase
MPRLLPGSSTRVALYLRVSTASQTTHNQAQALQDAIHRLGWAITAVFEDAGLSGSLSRQDRPGFDALMKAVARREIDVVAAWDASRLSRSLKDLVDFLGELKARRVGLYLHQSGIDTTTPSGQALLQMLGVFSELERGLIVERIRAGLDRARREGKRLGRPPLPDATIAAIRDHLRAGNGIHKTSRMVGCGVSVVQRVREELLGGAAAA